MRSAFARAAVAITTVAFLTVSCSDDTPGSSSTTTTVPATTITVAPQPTQATTTTAPPETTTTSTTTTIPAGPTVAAEGDRSESVEAVQFLLNCSSYGDLTVDGAYGPATRGAVEAAQAALGLAADGAEVSDALFAALSRACSDRRRIDGEGELTVVGNAAPGDPEVYELALRAGTTVTAAVTGADGIALVLSDGEGEEIVPQADVWTIETTRGYLLTALPAEEAVTFVLSLEVTPGAQQAGAWVLATNGITYSGTKLSIGDDAETVIEKVFDFLGHGVRGAYAEFDTGWYPTEGASPIGLRGIFIEGLAFLFYGPADPDNPDRPETLARIRFEGPSDDAAGNPRPDNYVTTADGITVGHTLADLTAAYGSKVKAGDNDEEWYYRLTDSGGELCFYFAEDPTEFSVITEIATECRD